MSDNPTQHAESVALRVAAYLAQFHADYNDTQVCEPEWYLTEAAEILALIDGKAKTHAGHHETCWYPHAECTCGAQSDGDGS